MTRRWLLPLLPVFVVIGCDTQSQRTVAPDGGESSPGELAEKDKERKLPQVRDRDPEQERKKLELSREHSAQARSFLRSGKLGDAITHSREALKIHEQNVDAMLVIAEAFFRQGKFELTQAVTTSALAVDPKIRTPQETSMAHNLMGFALLQLGKDNQATQAFKKAAEADDKNAAAWNNLGTRYLDTGDVKTALSCFDYALELRPGFVKAHLNRGAALRAQSQWVDAEREFGKALQLQPDYADAYFNLGLLYLDADPFPGLDTTKRLNKAIANLTKYRELAIADGPGGPRPAGVGQLSKPGKPSQGIRKGAAPAPAPVSPERADDYIRIAKKGLDREQKRIERQQKNGTGGGADAGAGEAQPSGASSGASPTPSEAAPSTQGGGAPASETKPAPGGATKPQAPGGATQPQPQAPGGATKPQAPGGGATQPPGGGATQPKPQAPGGSPPPATPSPKPPSSPNGGAGDPAKPPGVQKPAVQKPGQQASTDGSTPSTCVELREAWNPLRREDTNCDDLRTRHRFDARASIVLASNVLRVQMRPSSSQWPNQWGSQWGSGASRLDGVTPLVVPISFATNVVGHTEPTAQEVT